MNEFSISTIKKVLNQQRDKETAYLETSEYLKSLTLQLDMCDKTELGLFHNFVKLNEKTVYVITGGIAAGKSTFAADFIKCLGLDNIPFVGTDSLYNSYFKGKTVFETDYGNARAFTKTIVNHLIMNNYSFVWETVFSKQSKFEILYKCKELGYKINCVFVASSDPIVLCDRSKQRVEEGCHFVEDSFIIDRFNKSNEAIIPLKELVDAFAIIDNSDVFRLVYYEDRNGLISFELPNYLEQFLKR